MSSASLYIRQFQSTLPRGERLIDADELIKRIGFQSTLPRGERLYKDVGNKKCQTDFNPRSREGSDRKCQRISYSAERISIHAPARGATPATTGQTITVVISIHAPARGATGLLYLYRLPQSNFNPRSREGSDRD